MGTIRSGSSEAPTWRFENISMLAAKIVEDCRIWGSPLEKSTRYIYFDQKVNGEYLYSQGADPDGIGLPRRLH